MTISIELANINVSIVDDDTPNTEQRILDAARQEFVRRGFTGARMQAIAEKAGVNKALLHYYFRSKTNLYDRIFKEIVVGLWGQVRIQLDAIPGPADLRQYIRAMVSTYIQVLSANPDFPKIFFRELIDGGENISRLFGDLLPAIGDVPQRIVGALIAEMHKGTIRAVNPAQVMLNILGMTAATFLFGDLTQIITTVAKTPVTFNQKFLEERIEAITQMACDGIFV